MVQIISNSFKEIKINKLGFLNLRDIYIIYSGKYISLDKVEVIVKADKIDDKKIIKESRKLKNTTDLKSNYSNLCFRDESGIYTEILEKPKLFYKGFTVPSTYESTSINTTGAKDAETVPYGLKRKLKVEAQEPKSDIDGYLYVKVKDSFVFIKKDEIYYFKGTEKKTYLEAVAEGENLETLSFFDSENNEITAIYTEHQYNFTQIVAREKINLKNNTRVLYTIDEDGEEVEQDSVKISLGYSEQTYKRIQEYDETRPGKKKSSGQITTVNYRSVVVDESSKNNSNLYVSLTVKNALNSRAVMVQLADLVDENNKAIADLSLMVGKRVNIKKDGFVVATSEPLTYEQANLRFDTVKIYQEYDNAPDETSCLRLEDGEYINELSAIQPISFKVAKDEIDSYLVEQTIGDKKRFVVVSADYFEKHSNSKGLNNKKAIPLVRCDMHDKDCSVIQTTSNEQSIEECAIVGDIKLDGELLTKSSKTKQQLFEIFKEDYSNKKYKITEVVHNGKFRKIQEKSKRYQYTDEHIYADYAEELTEYQALNSKNIKIENGKIVGGSKFKIGEGIKSDFKKWHKFLVRGLPIAAAAGIFAPVVGVVAGAIYGVGMILAIPGIPIVNTIRGIVKNISKKYTNKVEFNRNKEVENINEQIASLTESHSKMDQKQFDDVYSKLMARISTLSQTTEISYLNVENGSAQVDSNNIALADKYVKEYKKTKKKLDFYELRVAQYKAIGKNVPEKLQQEYDSLKEKMDTLTNGRFGISYDQDSRMEALQFRASSLSAYHKLTTLEGEKLQEFLDEMKLGASFDVSRITYDAKKGIMLDRIPVMATEKEQRKAFKKDNNRKELWLEVREKIVVACKKFEVVELKEPLYNEQKTFEEEVVVTEENTKENENGKELENDNNKKKGAQHMYDAKIVSEDSLVELLKARPESKKRQTLIAEIEKRAGVKISEEDIIATINRIDTKHNPTKGERKSATAGAQTLKNKNIYNILVYGQQYLTEYAQAIKQRTAKPAEHTL